MSHQISRKLRTATLKIVAIYALFGLAWIYGSDTVLGWLANDPAVMVKIAVIKGSLFILCTATLLYILINRFVQKLAAAEKSRTESLKNYGTIFNATNEAIIILDARSGRIIDVNDRMLEVFGYGYEEALAVEVGGLSEGKPPYSKVEVVEKISKAVSEGPQVYEWLSRKKSGELFWSEVSLKKIASDDNDRFIAVVRDISERKRAEEERMHVEKQLLNSQKLESLGVMAGGIAHDFNNLLAVIIGHCSMAKLRPQEAGNHITPIETAAARAAELCRQMLAYAGKTHIVKTRIDFAALVDEMAILVKSSIGQNAELKLCCSADIPAVLGDASQLSQVVMNLIINAAEAIGEKHGEIRVSLSKTEVNSDQSDDKDHQGKAIAPGWYACLEVTDNGCGMDDETIRRIFEPFYTTKFTGRGLGMSAVLGIITAHNGALQLFSRQGQGTSFRVYLPVQADVSCEDKSRMQAAPPVPWKGTGTVLLVEDEEQILHLAKEMLEELGFTVITASNGREGLQMYHENAFDIGLVITDMGMPVMNGYEMFRELKSIRADLPIIVSSGFGDADVTSRIALEDIAGLIGKPYSYDQLREVLKSVVDGRLSIQT